MILKLSLNTLLICSIFMLHRPLYCSDPKYTTVAGTNFAYKQKKITQIQKTLQNGMSTMRRLRLAWAFTLSGQSLLSV